MATSEEGASYEQLGTAPTGAMGKRKEMSMRISPQQYITMAALGTLCLPLLCLGQARQSGALTGTIESTSGQPIADARVAVYSALGVNGPTDPALHIGNNAGFAATDAKGGFSVAV